MCVSQRQIETQWNFCMTIEAVNLGDLDLSQPIGQQLYRILRDAIIRGDLEPGARVSEAVIAGLLDVSRQPVRETFIRLSDEGLLEVRPQRGTYVPKISERTVRDARFVREAIEADTARLAAEQFDDSQIAVLRDLLAQQKSCIDVDPKRFIELDDQFHKFFAEGVGHGQAWRVVESQKAQLDRVRFISLREFPMGALVEQHTAIVDAIAAHDPDAAALAMRAHLKNVLIDLPRIAKTHPDLFT